MRTYLFASSKPFNREPYRTTVHDNGAITCSCPARVECWHIKEVRSRPIVGRTEVTAVPSGDKLAILALLDEGNDRGAQSYALDLFPSMSLEEAGALLEEIQQYEHTLSARADSDEP